MHGFLKKEEVNITSFFDVYSQIFLYSNVLKILFYGHHILFLVLFRDFVYFLI